MLSFYYVVTFAAVLLHGVPRSQESTIGDPCTLNSTRSQGICKLLSNCHSAIEQLQKFQRRPQICGFQNVTPVVCCPEDSSVPRRTPGEISYKKCKEYSKYAEEENSCGHGTNLEKNESEIKEFPHLVVVGYEEEYEENKTVWGCSGTIISEQYILTAAGCSRTVRGNAKYVRMGVTNFTDDGPYSQTLKIAEIIVHPDYKGRSFYNDIALLKLEKAAKMNTYSRPACLFTESQIKVQKAIAIAWTTYLKKGNVDIFEHQSCNTTYTKNNISPRLAHGIMDNTQICAGSVLRTKDDSCLSYDAGGPLQIYHVHDDIKCMYDIIGVPSFGPLCRRVDVPEVYTRVSYFIKWIEDIVWPETS